MPRLLFSIGVRAFASVAERDKFILSWTDSTKFTSEVLVPAQTAVTQNLIKDCTSLLEDHYSATLSLVNLPLDQTVTFLDPQAIYTDLKTKF